MTDALRMVLSVKRPFVFLLIMLLTMPRGTVPCQVYTLNNKN